MKKKNNILYAGTSRMFLVLTILFFGGLTTKAQLRMQNEPARPSADSWEMIKYGEIEPSLYTGTLNLQIPFYTYKDNDFEIPISFNYASNGCIPNSRPGIMGPGWQLAVGGVITREIRGIPDNVDENGLAVGFWYPFSHEGSPISRCLSATYYPVFYMSPEQPNTYTIQNEDPIQMFHNGVLYTTSNISGTIPDEDAEPDLFHFNVMGYSGSFCLDTAGRIVVFDTNFNSKEITIDIEVNQSNNVSTLYFSGTPATVAQTDRFASITLTTSDGYKYVFNGATTNNGNNSENDCSNLDILYSTNNQYDINSAPADILAWHLSRIVAPNGRIVTFNYAKTPLLKCVRPATFFQAESCFGVSGTLFNHNVSTTQYYSVAENAVLESILFDNGASVVFGYGHNYFDSYQNGSEATIKLESISLTYDDTYVITADLTYTNAKNATDPFLSEINISGEGAYSFSYYNVGAFPSIGESRLDHWGYFNGRVEVPLPTPPTDPNDTTYSEEDYAFLVEQNSHVKESDPTKGVIGLLSQVSYPTGGYSIFNYEGNTFSKAVVRDEASDYEPELRDSISTFCGGLRICRIRDYDTDNTLLKDRRFNYMKANGESSGILTYIPLYEYSYSCVGSTANLELAGMSYVNIIRYGQVSGVVRSNNLTRYGSTHIEYSRVIETRGDGSSIEYDFSTSATPGLLDTLYVGNAWLDLGYSMPQNSLRNACRAVAQTVSKQHFRGRLTSKKYYDDNGVLLYEENNTYGNLRNDEYLDYCRLVRACTSRKTLTGEDKLVSEEKKQYNNGGIFIQTGVNKQYNNNGLLESSSAYDSKGILTRKTYTYVSSLSSNPVELLMHEHNVIRYPVVEQEYYDGVLIRQRNTSYCLPDSTKESLFRPETVIDTDCINGQSLTTSYYYDKKGNIIGIQHPDGTSSCIIWGYGGLYPLAFVEGCSLESLTNIQGFESINNEPFSGALGSLEVSLRASLPYGAEVSTFEYIPLVGLTREKGPDGRSIDYKYNNTGKLKSIFDNTGTKLKSFFYSTDN